MSGQQAESIIQDFAAHMGKQGGPMSSWYVSVSEDVRRRFFGDHRVPEADHWFIYRRTVSEHDARLVERYFLDQGARGGPGGGDQADWVYAYLMTAQTEP